MMRGERRAVLFTAVALGFAASPLIAAAGSTTVPPRVTEEQAKQKAAAVAKALDAPWDDSATATLTPTGTDRKALPPDPPLWAVRCRGARVQLRGDTGAVLGFSRPGETKPSPGRKPPTEREAIAAATRGLHVLGAAPDAPPKEANESWDGWHLLWERRTPDGIPYYGDTTSATVDVAGRVVSAGVFWPSRPPESTKAKVSKRRAVSLALDAARQSGRLGTGRRTVTARLEIIRPSDFGRMYTKYYDVPTRLVWAVSIIRPAARSEHVVAIDAANGRALGSYSSLWTAPPEQRARALRVRLAAWVASGALAAAFAAAVAYLARRREERPVEEQEG